ncbi:type II and III secretion system protein family protein [Thalassomonas sp. M1454]|uniref:type II and III secretion system protein family protein n=1 Tax=Thalassomonas sp. M1454 TaxID=2594477 RepID=UPI0011802D31|nr:type II and III secretion system protein family protein [Thalassomonas sp. M1454]TRX54444.1 type II and III secretion system protein family protein [Thalassomonas sp. M1454]
MKMAFKVVPFLVLSLSITIISINFNSALAGGPTVKEDSAVKVPIFKSRNLQMKQDIHRVSIGNPDIADILVLRSDELYVVGKELGHTNVMIWDENDKVIDVFNLEVSHDLNGLRERFYHYLPNEKIGIESSQGQLVLSGQSSSLTKMNLAVELARSYAEAASVGGRSSEVLNMLSVGGGHQIMLEVTVAEVQTEVARRLDSKMLLQFDGSDGSGGIVSGGDLFNAIGVTPAISQGIFGTYLSGDMLLSFAFDVAKQHGLAKILAEPNITALSGQKAEFLSGGEYPIPVPNEDGITIEYRDFGVGVSFVPTILDSGKINLSLNVLVSELSSTHAMALTPTDSNSRIIVPSITKRTTATTVELGDGQTIAIGGLISDTLRETVDKIPGLGDIPILGQLFRSQEFVKGQTELVIMVTPRLVRPFNKKDIELPTDNFVPVSDMEFYLLGRMTPREDPEEDEAKEKSPNEIEDQNDEMLPDDGGTQEKYGHELSSEESGV